MHLSGTAAPDQKFPHLRQTKFLRAQEKGNAVPNIASPPTPLCPYLNIPVTSIPFWQPRLVANTGTQTMEPIRNCKRCSHISSTKDKGSKTDNSLLAYYPAIKKKTQVRRCHFCQGKQLRIVKKRRHTSDTREISLESPAAEETFLEDVGKEVNPEFDPTLILQEDEYQELEKVLMLQEEKTREQNDKELDVTFHVTLEELEEMNGDV